MCNRTTDPYSAKTEERSEAWPWCACDATSGLPVTELDGGRAWCEVWRWRGPVLKNKEELTRDNR